MISLIYPEGDYAPVIPARKAEDVKAMFDREKSNVPASSRNRGQLPGTEWLPVIQDDGQVIGMATRDYCHGGAGLLHPVVHLHILDRNGRIYLQKRSMSKRCQPGRWDTAVGGHVDYGETVMEALANLGSRMELQFGELCALNGEQMTGRVLDFTEQAFVAAPGIAAFIADCGMKALLARMDFARELTSLFRKLSPRLFAREGDRQKLVDAAQEHLDELITEENDAQGGAS